MTFRNTTVLNIALALLLAALSGCGPTVIPTKGPPPSDTWEMTQDAYVIDFSPEGAANPYLSLSLVSQRNPNVLKSLTLPGNRSPTLAVRGLLSKFDHVRIVEIFWKNTSLFSGFWMKVEILSGEMKGVTLSLPDMFYVVRSEKQKVGAFKFKGKYYEVMPVSTYVRRVGL